MIAERAFTPALGRIDVAFEDDLRVRGDLEVDRARAYHLDAPAAQPPCEHDLVDAGWQRR